MSDVVCIYHGCGRPVYVKRYQLCRQCYQRERHNGLKTPEQRNLEIEYEALKRAPSNVERAQSSAADRMMEILSIAQRDVCQALVMEAIGSGLFWVNNQNPANGSFEANWLRQAANAAKYFQPEVLAAEDLT